jgi:ABC-type transport system involved in multi-copper enzyme maturation permease subunit
MDNILSIARSTYWRHASSKALYLLWVLLIVLIASATRYDVLSIGRSKVLTVDLGLALIALVGAGSIMILGLEVPRELRQRIAENLLSKPVGRDQYLMGKFLGAFLFAMGNVIFISIGFAVVLLVTENAITEQFLMPLVGIVGMVLILASAAALFGTFLSEVPAVIATFLVFWLGHSSQAIAKFADGMTGAGRTVLRAVYGLLPNLNLLNTRGDFSQTMFAKAPGVPWSYAGVSLAYALLYAIVLFVTALLIFRRRDL